MRGPVEVVRAGRAGSRVTTKCSPSTTSLTGSRPAGGGRRQAGGRVLVRPDWPAGVAVGARVALVDRLAQGAISVEQDQPGFFPS